MALGKCTNGCGRGVLGRSDYCAVWWKARKHGSTPCSAKESAPGKGERAGRTEKSRLEGAQAPYTSVRGCVACRVEAGEQLAHACTGSCNHDFTKPLPHTCEPKGGGSPKSALTSESPVPCAVAPVERHVSTGAHPPNCARLCCRGRKA